MDNKLKYSLKGYKRDNVIHETFYYEIVENNKSIYTTQDRLHAYKWISYNKRMKKENTYRLYKHIIQRLKTEPNETI